MLDCLCYCYSIIVKLTYTLYIQQQRDRTAGRAVLEPLFHQHHQAHLQSETLEMVKALAVTTTSEILLVTKPFNNFYQTQDVKS